MPPKGQPTDGGGDDEGIRFTVVTSTGRTRTARPRVREVILFHEGSAAESRRLREAIGRAVQRATEMVQAPGGFRSRFRFNGEYGIDGTITKRTRRVTFEQSVRDMRIGTLAYLLQEGGRSYFVAGPPVTLGVQRRVHLLIGRDDSRVYVRKLVRSEQEPTEARLWPQLLNVALRGNPADQNAPPGAPRFVSCVRLGKDPHEAGDHANKIPYWSIISEWMPGVTLERAIRYLAEQGGTIHPAIISHIAADLFQAIRHLRQEGKVHQDMTPANILIDQRGDEMPYVTLIDFSTMRKSGDSDDSPIPNDIAHMKVKPAFGVSLCLADMYSLRYGYQPGKAVEVLFNNGQGNLIKDLQAAAKTSGDDHDWTGWGDQHRRDGDLALNALIPPASVGRILPPEDHKFGQTQPPTEPLAFGRKYWITGEEILAESNISFMIGPHSKVWIEPYPWRILKTEEVVVW